MPYVEQRDAVSISVVKQSSEFRHVLDQLTQIETESLRLSRGNVELAAEVLRLAKETEGDISEPLTDPRTKEELDRLEREVKASRQK